MHRRNAASLAVATGLLLAVPGVSVQAQEESAREAAPIDITGYWVSLITDDWVFRMITPAKGDYSYVPLNDLGRRVADTWDPQRDEAAGEACKGYAAPAIMRLPGRLHISWEDENTLRIDIDTGMQTRLLRFGGSAPRNTEPTWQGYSAAEWEVAGGRQTGFRGSGSLRDVVVAGSLRVDTTNLRPGYLRKNGVPFSEDTFMTEYFNLLTEADGNQYLVIQTFVDDPQYLASHFIRSLQFKREPDDSKWNPTPCAAH